MNKDILKFWMSDRLWRIWVDAVDAIIFVTGKTVLDICPAINAEISLISKYKNDNQLSLNI
jgi:hypothetical protein